MVSAQKDQKGQRLIEKENVETGQVGQLYLQWGSSPVFFHTPLLILSS